MYTSVGNLHCSGVRASLSREGLERDRGGLPSGRVEHVYIHVHAYTCTYAVYVHTYLILKSSPHKSTCIAECGRAVEYLQLVV